MSEEKIDNVVEIVEPVEVAKEEIDISVVSAEEKKMAEDLGILDKPVEGKVEEKVEDKKVESKKNENQTFEDTEKNEKELINNYSKNEQALYWKWKHDKKERQSAQRESELATIREKALKLELGKIKENENLSVEKLNKINALLSGDPESITVEALQAIIAEKKVKTEDNKDRPLTVKDLELLQEKNKQEIEEKSNKEIFIKNRLTDAEEYGKNNIENYETIIDLAHEVLEGKVDLPKIIDNKSLSTKLVEAISNKDIDLETISEYVVGIAKLNPKFGSPKKSSDLKKETNSNIDRVLKNASMQQTSAAVGGSGNGRRLVSYDDLTLEEASKLPQGEYDKLPEKVRRRLKMEASQI